VAEQVQAKRFYVSGRVQGVGYRFFAQRAAERLGLTGYVKNLGDGRVEVFVIGPPAKLQILRAELQRGPRHALIDGLEESDAAVPAGGTTGFSITHD
jgi:acylphosphatase